MTAQIKPAVKLIAVPAGGANTDLAAGRCRALLVGGGGLANIMQSDGTIHTGVPLTTGYNPISVLQVRTSTAATNIWALY